MYVPSGMFGSENVPEGPVVAVATGDATTPHGMLDALCELRQV